jgi:ribosomal protein L37AE/L43A
MTDIGEFDFRIYDYVEITPNPPCPRCRKPMRLIKSRGIYMCRWCGLIALGRVVIERGI